MAYKVRKLQITAGTNITITNSEQDTINSLTIDGRCEQETTSGKQLYNYKDADLISHSTSNEEGWITASVNNTSGTTNTFANWFTKPSTLLKTNTNYKLVVEIKDFRYNDSISYIYFGETSNNSQFKNTAIIHFGEMVKKTYVFNLTTKDNFDNAVFMSRTFVRIAPSDNVSITYRVSVLEDTTVAEDNFVYEEFTGGQPSPNPDYPQNISVLTGNLKLTSCGKNLLNIEDYTKSNDTSILSINNREIKFTTPNNARYEQVIYFNNITLKANKTYTIVRTKSNEIPSTMGQVELYKGSSWIKVILSSDKNSNTFTVDKDNVYRIRIKLSNANQASYTGTISDIMVSEAGGNYEPYQDSSLNITIPENEFVGKLDDTYKDTLNVVYKDDGHYHLILNKMVGKVVLDGSEKYTNSGVSSNNFIYMMKTIINDIKSAANDAEFVPVMSNYFSNGFSYTSLGYSIAGTNGITIAQNNTLTICHSDYTKENTEGFKNWLSTHNTEVYYPLATPYEVDLGIVDMPNTYKGTTHIFNSVDTNMSVTYSVLGFNKRFEEIVYSGGAIYNCILKINDVQVPNSQIAKITISNPIIDTNTEYLYVGSYIAQKLTIKFKNLDNLDIKSNNNVTLDISLDVDGTPAVVPIGKFLIDDLSENYYETCEINCLDYSIKAKPNIDYSPCFVDGKAKIDTILEYICNHFGIELDSNYPKTNGNIETGLYDNTLSGKRYISYIAELKGCNAKHGRDGKLYLIPIKQASNVIINVLKSKSWKLGEKFQISKVAYDDGARLFEKGDTTNNTLFIRNDNPFIQDQTTIDNIYDIVKDTIIWNLKTENYGDISLDPWDNITYTLGKESYNTLMNTNIVYEMTIMSTNEVKLPTKQQEITTNIVGGDTNSKFIRVGRTIDLINGEIKDLSEKIVDVSNNVSGVGTVNITNGSKGILHKLDIYGTLELPIIGGQLGSSATKVGYSKVGASIVKTSMPYIKPLIVGQFTVNSFKIIIKQGDNTKEYIIDDMKNLYQVGTTHDTFEYLDGKCSIIRRIGINNDGTKYILDTPHVEQLKDLNIEVPEGDYTISVNYNELHLDVEYLTKNEYTDVFATQVDVSSMIKVARDEVLIQSKREILDNGDELIASINTKSTGEVLIDATKAIDFNSAEFNVTTQKMKITIGEGDDKKDLINASGVLTNLIYIGYIDGTMFVGSGDYIPLGRVGGGNTADTQRNKCTFAFKLPTNYVVQSAKIYLSHAPTVFTYGENQTVTGYSRNLKLYKGNPTNLKMHFNMNSSMSYTEGASYSEIYNAFGSDGFTGDANKTTNIQSIDIKEYIDTNKENFLSIYDGNYTTYTNNEDIFSHTGSVFAYLEIIGYSQI